MKFLQIHVHICMYIYERLYMNDFPVVCYNKDR